MWYLVPQTNQIILLMIHLDRGFFSTNETAKIQYSVLNLGSKMGPRNILGRKIMAKKTHNNLTFESIPQMIFLSSNTI